MKTKVDKVTGQPREDDVIQADPLSISLKRILTSQLTAIEDATDAASAITQLNLLLEAARIHGLILILSGELTNELTNIAAPTLCTIDENFDISVTWTDNTGTGTAAADDIINFILYNVSTDIVKKFTALRENAGIQIFQTESDISENDEVALFYFASNAARTIFSNTAPATLTEAAPEQQALEITWDDIANAPARTLEAWNTLLNLPSNGTAFTSYEEIDNTIKLFGASSIHLTYNVFTIDSHLISFIDNAGCIISMDDESFYSSINVTSFKLPSIISCGGSEYNDNVFSNISGNSITLTIPHAIESDGDIVALKANNTVTVIYSD